MPLGSSNYPVDESDNPLFPDFAVNTDGTDHDVVDPVSNEHNVIEPDAVKKLTGWNYTEKPPRNWMNWLHRLTAQWTRWAFNSAWTGPRSDGVLWLNASLTNGGYFQLPAGEDWTKFIIVSAFVQRDDTHFCPLPYIDGAGNHAAYTFLINPAPYRVRIYVEFGNVTPSFFPTSPQWRFCLMRMPLDLPKNCIDDYENPVNWWEYTAFS
jgi:hypothetical protein